jgi:hypothetical protein
VDAYRTPPSLTAVTDAVAVPEVEAPARPAPTKADPAVRRVLCIPDGRTARDGEAQSAFSKSIMISAVRCLLTYVVLPFIAPVLGVAAGVGPVLGLVIGIIAIIANVMTIRRFFAAEHRYRWAYAALSVSVIGLLSILIVKDLAELAGV